MHKDIRLARDASRQEGVPLPSAATADAVFSDAGMLGYGDRDIAGPFEMLSKASG